MKSETPKTDAAEGCRGYDDSWIPMKGGGNVTIEFARELERQLRDLVTSCNEYGGAASISHPRYTRQLYAARKFLENV